MRASSASSSKKHLEGADDVDGIDGGPPGHHIDVDETLRVVEGNHHLHNYTPHFKAVTIPLSTSTLGLVLHLMSDGVAKTRHIQLKL